MSGRARMVDECGMACDQKDDDLKTDLGIGGRRHLHVASASGWSSRGLNFFSWGGVGFISLALFHGF